MSKSLKTALSEKGEEISKILAMENIDHQISRIAGLLHLPISKEAKVLLNRIHRSVDGLIKYAEMAYNRAYHIQELQGISENVISALANWYGEEIAPYIEERYKEKKPYFVQW